MLLLCVYFFDCFSAVKKITLTEEKIQEVSQRTTEEKKTCSPEKDT
jgi:hypothetical protein